MVWNETLDPKNFNGSRKKGLGTMQPKIMIDCFKNEDKWNAWILYKHEKAIGSVVAHTFPK